MAFPLFWRLFWLLVAAKARLPRETCPQNPVKRIPRDFSHLLQPFSKALLPLNQLISVPSRPFGSPKTLGIRLRLRPFLLSLLLLRLLRVRLDSKARHKA